MIAVKWAVRAAATAFALLFSSGVSFAAPSADIFGNLPLVTTGRLSPDATHLALIQPVNGRAGVVIYDLTKPNAPPHMVTLEKAVAQTLFWKRNDRLICIFTANLEPKYWHHVQPWARAVTVDQNGGDAQVMLLRDQPELQNNLNGAMIVDPAADDPWHVYMVAWETNAAMNGHAPLVFDEYYLNLFRVNVVTGYPELVLHGTEHTVQYLMDGHDQPLGYIEQDTNIRDHVFLGTKEVASFDARAEKGLEFEGLTMGPNPAFAVQATDSAGVRGIYQWSTAGVGPALFSNPKYDVVDILTDEHTGRILGAEYIDDRPHRLYSDPTLQHVQNVLEKAFPGQSVAILSRDATGATYLIKTEGPRNPPVLSLYTAANHQVNIVQEAYPSIKPADLGEMKPYPYKGRDGLEIPAYLTLPPGKQPHNLPTVIFPHGGPEARDSMAFDWWTQFMAAKGYAVLQPNYRGSFGYGSDFTTAADGEWAGKVQNDLQDGVQKLIADGIADPKRICIVGASWGGYLALGGVTYSPDVYACAISYAGISDLHRLTYTGTTFESEASTTIKRQLGTDKDSGKLDSQSPANFAERVKAPVLLIHGDHDTTVKIEQSEVEQRALKNAGKQVEFVTLEGDDHYLEYANTRIQLLKEVERFLDQHLGGGASPAPVKPN
jgi:dienelactone hydrolase